MSLQPKASPFSEKIIFNFLYQKLEGWITQRQFFFQSKKSSVLQWIEVSNTVNLETSTTLFMVYSSYAQAFNRKFFQAFEEKLSNIAQWKSYPSLRILFSRQLQKCQSSEREVRSFASFEWHSWGICFRPSSFHHFFVWNAPRTLGSSPWLLADELKLLFNSLNSERDLLCLNWCNLANGMPANVLKTKCVVLHGDVSLFLSNELIENKTWEKSWNQI